jgi:hypothetical protein
LECYIQQRENPLGRLMLLDVLQCICCVEDASRFLSMSALRSCASLTRTSFGAKSSLSRSK